MNSVTLTVLFGCLLLVSNLIFTEAKEFNFDISSLRSDDLFKIATKNLRMDHQLLGKSAAAYSGGGGRVVETTSPLIEGINSFVDAIGNALYAILQTLGLVPAQEAYQHVYYSDQCRYY